MINKCIFIGNLGKDPELKTTTTGKSVANFSLAVQGFKTENGYLTDWVPVVCWEKTAENVSKYLSKGSKVFVEGRFSTRSWDDKDGNKRYTTEIVANEVKFLDPAKKDTGFVDHKVHPTNDIADESVPF